MASSWRRSWALRMIGFAKAPHSLSAMMVAARARSVLVALLPRSSQTKMSGSTIALTVSATFTSSAFTLRGSSLGGSLPRSMFRTRLGDTPASPIKRSTARGGQVDILSVRRTDGSRVNRSTPMSVMSWASLNARSTCSVASSRIFRYVWGANRTNQSLYRSTDRAMSFFQRSGLSRLTAIVATPWLFSLVQSLGHTAAISGRDGLAGRRGLPPYPVNAAITASTQASALACISSSVASWIGCGTKTHFASSMPSACAWVAAASTKAEDAMLTAGTP